MQQKDAKELLDKYLTGQNCPEEDGLIERAYNLQAGKAENDVPSPDLEGMKAEVWNKLEHGHHPVQVRFALWKKIAVAAAVLLIAGIFSYELLKEDKVKDGTDVVVVDISPGGNKAFLTLGNGKRISVTDAISGQVAMENGVKIIKAPDGSLVYKHVATSGKAVLNTFETPRGGMSQLVLPDGSRVWLNAESSISYLSSFAGMPERRVELSGEAYFEVAKDKLHPFIVKTARQEVEVLGTHFNISDYRGDKVGRTTLLEGSVRVLAKVGALTKVLKPDQQAIVTSGTLATQVVDVDEMIAWKNGKFLFNEESLEEIMQKVGRWYDVDVVYKDDKLKKITLGGTVSRFSNISEVFEILELTGLAHFKIEGRKIIVSK